MSFLSFQLKSKVAVQYGAVTILIFSLIMTVDARNLYVNNISGNDKNDGLFPTSAFASIEKAFAAVETSDHIDIANTGKPYQRPYPGPRGVPLSPKCGGTVNAPLIVNGNGAVISGLSSIPSEKWVKESENLYSIFFYPMANFYKNVKQDNFWLDETQIWWIDGRPAFNSKSLAEVLQKPGSFWWNKAEKKLIYHLPEKEKLESLKIEIPSNSGIYITHDHTIVQNLTMIFSWNDGFDIARSPKNVIYKNCTAYNNCGQGFSCHDTGSAYYEDCAAIRCASSGSCDVNWSNSSYKRCIFINNTYEAGIFAAEESIHSYEDCLVAGNRPFEQVWQRGHSKMNFLNSVIVGNSDNMPAIQLTNGSICFRNCTIVNAASICSVPYSLTGSLTVENCILAGCKDFFF